MEKYVQYRDLVRGWAFALCLALAGSPALGQQQACRLALSLALDVSSSVDAQEYALQNEGLARALTAPEVVAAFLAVPGWVVTLHVFEWSGREQHTLRLAWTDIASEADLRIAAERLGSGARSSAAFPTALGSALLYGATALADRRDCVQHALDVSGDGVNNDGPVPDAARRALPLPGITVNGLVIGPSHATLRTYYERFVIQGASAFVEVATDYADFERAMRRKLLRELGVMVVGATADTPGAISRPDPQ